MFHEIIDLWAGHKRFLLYYLVVNALVSCTSSKLFLKVIILNSFITIFIFQMSKNLRLLEFWDLH